MDEAWNCVKRSIRLANAISDAGNAPSLRTDLQRSAKGVIERCRTERKRARALEVPADLSDEAVRVAAKWSKRLPLRDYDGLLHHVPRLVNVVTCAEAVPVPGSGATLPLDLHHIGSRCSNAYFAPRRFSAVQLAFDWPRCRVLIFHTGRLVGTGAFTRISLRTPRLAPHAMLQAAPARWPRASRSCARCANWPSKPTSTCTCAIFGWSTRWARRPSTRVWTATHSPRRIPQRATLIARALSVWPRPLPEHRRPPLPARSLTALAARRSRLASPERVHLLRCVHRAHQTCLRTLRRRVRACRVRRNLRNR